MPPTILAVLLWEDSSGGQEGKLEFGQPASPAGDDTEHRSTLRDHAASRSRRVSSNGPAAPLLRSPVIPVLHSMRITRCSSIRSPRAYPTSSGIPRTSASIAL